MSKIQPASHYLAKLAETDAKLLQDEIERADALISAEFEKEENPFSGGRILHVSLSGLRNTSYNGTTTNCVLTDAAKKEVVNRINRLGYCCEIKTTTLEAAYGCGEMIFDLVSIWLPL